MAMSWSAVSIPTPAMLSGLVSASKYGISGDQVGNLGVEGFDRPIDLFEALDIGA